MRWHDVGGVRLREVNGAQLSSRYLRCVRQLELARVDADERPLWRYNTSITERASTSGPDVEFVSLADGSAGVRVTGSSTGATGHEDYDEVDVTLRLSDGQPAR